MYTLKQAKELSYDQIKSIIGAWNVPDWKSLTEEQFRAQFRHSEFHLITEQDSIKAVVRINHAFRIILRNEVHSLSEMVGLVSLEKGKGYGKELITHMRSNLIKRNIECLGFCFAYNQGFYEKCGIEVLKGKGTAFATEVEGKYVLNDDDDVVNINLLPDTRSAILAASKDSPILCLIDENIQNPEVCEI